MTQSIVCIKYGVRRSCLVVFTARGLIVATTALGCGDNASNDRPLCYLGEERPCVDSNGCTGTETCFVSDWSDCVCNAVTPDTSTPVSARLGGSCRDTSDCPTGTTCLDSSSTLWFGGGPPEGICVADCAADAAVCRDFEAAACVTIDPSHAYCMPSCNVNAGANDSSGCGTVPHSVCDVLPGQATGFCRPICVLDSDCGSGICDRRYGSCVLDLPASLTVALGQRCTPDAQTCNGVCLELSPGNHVCSARCLFGTTNECADSLASERFGVCAYAGTEPAQKGSLGYCAALCNCNDDCAASGFVCEAFTVRATASTLAHQGMCIPNLDSSGKTHTGLTCP